MTFMYIITGESLGDFVVSVSEIVAFLEKTLFYLRES